MEARHGGAHLSSQYLRGRDRKTFVSSTPVRRVCLCQCMCVIHKEKSVKLLRKLKHWVHIFLSDFAVKRQWNSFIQNTELKLLVVLVSYFYLFGF